jgi:hypothetical protein
MQKNYEKELLAFEAQLTRHEIPPRLHHYTSMKSLLGIVEEKEIWFTNIEYLNDISEFKEGRNLFMEFLRKAEETFVSADTYASIRNYIEEMITPYDIFSFSVTEVRDSLEQWRGYANAESGVMVTLQGIFEHLDEAGITCMKVIYEEKEYVQQIRHLIEKMNKWDLTGADLQRSNFWGKFHRVLAKLFLKKKNAAFKHETEWKLFYSHKEIDDGSKSDGDVVKEKIRFRSAEYFIIPYSILDLTKLKSFDETGFIHEVLVSPMIKEREKDESRSIQGIKRLLGKNGIRRSWEKVDFSVLPYR